MKLPGEPWPGTETFFNETDELFLYFISVPDLPIGITRTPPSFTVDVLLNWELSPPH